MAGLPARYTVTLTENGIWTLLSVSLVGASHTARMAPSEDACSLTAFRDATIAVIADGVSDERATKSGEGARLAVQLAARAIARGLEAGLDADQAIAEAFSHAHNTLAQRTAAEGTFWGTYACTLAAAVLQGQAITVGHIGDSNAYHFDGRRLTRMATAPANEHPHLIVLPNWRDQFTTQTVDKPYVKAFVLATDGNDSFFLGRSPDDARLTNPEVTQTLHTIATNGASHFDVMQVVNALMKHPSYDGHDDRTMVWAFRKEQKP